MEFRIPRHAVRFPEWKRLIASVLRFAGCLLVCALSGVPNQLSGQQVQVGLSATAVPAGESTVYKLQIINAQLDALPEFPEVDGLEITVAGQNSHSSMQVVNGRMQRYNALIYQWKIVPEKEGVFLIPGLDYKIKGKAGKTTSVQLRVTKGIDYSQYAFIKLNLPKKRFYEGEPFAFSIDLYEQNARVEQAPELVADGFMAQRVSDNLRQEREVINNTAYNVWRLDYVARPVRHGELTLGPVSWQAGLIFRRQSRSRSVFDSFFNDLNTQRRQVMLQAEGEKLEILPLPEENRPDSFNGAIGRYQLEVTASPAKLTAGDPLTVTVKIVGEGPLDAIPMPPIDHWTGFKTYPPNARTEGVGPGKLKGMRIFEQVVIPQSSDLKELPPLDFSYFDTDTETYTTLRQAAIPIQVKANPGAPSMPTQSMHVSGESGLPTPKPKDVVPIKPFLGSEVSLATPWMMNPRFYWLQLVPVGLLGISWAVRQSRDRANRDPRGRRKRQVDQFVRQQLPELEKLAASQDSDAFFELMFRLLQERIGQCLDRPAASITESVLEASSDAWPLPESDAEVLHSLFQACNQARYAPVRSSEQLAGYAAQCREVLARLQ